MLFFLKFVGHLEELPFFFQSIFFSSYSKCSTQLPQKWKWNSYFLPKKKKHHTQNTIDSKSDLIVLDRWYISDAYLIEGINFHLHWVVELSNNVEYHQNVKTFQISINSIFYEAFWRNAQFHSHVFESASVDRSSNNILIRGIFCPEFFLSFVQLNEFWHRK